MADNKQLGDAPVEDLISQLNNILDDESKLNDLLNDESKLSNLTDEQLEKMLEKTSYYNNYIPAPKKWALISVTNWEEEFLRKFTMSSLVGWLYRILGEWNPDGETTAEEKEKSEEKREIVRQFLDRNLQFNPDKHVRGHHKKKFLKKEDMLVWDEDYLKEHKNNIDLDKKTSLEGSSEDDKRDTSIEGVVKVLNKPEIAAVAEKNVPVDAFYHWRRYTEVNYEELIHATCELYDTLPDLKWSVAFWNSFDKFEDAQEEKNKWRDNIKVPLEIIENNGHTLLGPWKTNREAIDYHNKNTELLKRMQDQAKADQKLGEDMMRKNIRNRKAQNIKEAGPDDPGLSAYMKAVNTIEQFGTKKGLTREEKTKLEQAYRAKDDEETPDNAVGVDVFRVNTDVETGEQSMTRKRLYTKADAPEDIAEQNRLRQAYFERKMIKDKHGNMVPLNDLQEKVDNLHKNASKQNNTNVSSTTAASNSSLNTTVSDSSQPLPDLSPSKTVGGDANELPPDNIV